MYEPRLYRQIHNPKGLVSFQVGVKETDLYISAISNLEKEAKEAIIECRESLENYIANKCEFLISLNPLPLHNDLPLAVRIMTESTRKVGVGPMAAVAGVIAELVGKELLKYSPEVIVENGGDIFIKTDISRIISIYSGENSPFKDKLAIEIDPSDSPLGICTSSGTVGHSLSFGKADSVTVISKDTGLADAAATAIGNIIQSPDDFENAIEKGKSITGLDGLILVKGDKLAVWGKVKLC
jgi:ApbE superfamily uncharacterized protein (UPF0280 family)